MKKLKIKWFNKWAKKQKLSNEKLLLAIEDMQNNFSSVNLGGGLYIVRLKNLKILARDILSLDDKLLWALINDGIFVQIGEKDEK